MIFAGSPASLYVVDLSKAIVQGDGHGLVQCNQVTNSLITTPGAEHKDVDVRITSKVM